MLKRTSWQKFHSRALHQLLVTDRPTHRLPLTVLLPMRPGPVGRGVIDQLVRIGRHLHLIDLNVEYRICQLQRRFSQRSLRSHRKRMETTLDTSSCMCIPVEPGEALLVYGQSQLESGGNESLLRRG